MPRDQCDAIVLRTYNVGEQDKIVVFFSGDKGLLRGIAKGARKFGSRFGSSLEPMSVVRVFFYEKERKDLLTISGCDLIESYFVVQNDFRTACLFSYFAELIEEFFPSRAEDTVVFRLLRSVLQAIKEEGNLSLISRYFEAWFLRINGLLPDVGRCKKCRKKLGERGWLSPRKDGAFCAGCAPQMRDEILPDVALFLGWARKNPPPAKGDSPFTAAQLDMVGKVLQEIIIYHLEKEPRALRHIRAL